MMMEKTNEEKLELSDHTAKKIAKLVGIDWLFVKILARENLCLFENSKKDFKELYNEFTSVAVPKNEEEAQVALLLMKRMAWEAETFLEFGMVYSKIFYVGLWKEGVQISEKLRGIYSEILRATSPTDLDQMKNITQSFPPIYDEELQEAFEKLLVSCKQQPEPDVGIMTAVNMFSDLIKKGHRPKNLQEVICFLGKYSDKWKV